MMSRKTRTSARYLFAAMTAATVLAATTGAAHASDSYTFSKSLTASYASNQQGLAYADGVHYVSYDTGDGDGRIVGYSSTGDEVRRSGELPLGHASEVSYRRADGNFYVTAYNPFDLRVRVVDMRTSPARLVRTIDFSHLGNRGMVAVDNERDQLIVKSGPGAGPHTFTTTDMQGNKISSFTDESEGTGQGLEVVGDDILLLTSAADYNSSKITVYDRAGRVRTRIHVPVAGESQGLSVDTTSGRVYMGTKAHSIYSMSPTYAQNLIKNEGAESGMSSWAVTGGLQSIRYDAYGHIDLTSPGPSQRGDDFFAGGTSATATKTQTVSTTNQAANIDDGAAYNFAAWLGGYKTQEDNARVTATFRSSTGATLATKTIGPVSATDRKGVSGLFMRTATGTVPVGTRSVKITGTVTRVAGTNADGYMDNLYFTIR